MAEEFDASYWEHRYRTHPASRQPAPGPQLTAETDALAPGLALDAGCGEGADAVWLASRGWRVTAVDVSPTALERAREHAASALDEAQAHRIDWVEADLTSWTPPERRFDLVTTEYVHAGSAPAELYARLAAAVAPGGTLLVVGHHPSDEHTASLSSEHVHFTADEIAAGLDTAWEVVTAEERTRRSDSHGGATLHDAVLRARRLP